jgi:hypothetical protein
MAPHPAPQGIILTARALSVEAAAAPAHAIPHMLTSTIPIKDSLPPARISPLFHPSQGVPVGAQAALDLVAAETKKDEVLLGFRAWGQWLSAPG